MAGKYQTMKIVKKLDEEDDKSAYQGVFMCTRCHGVLIDRSLDSFTDSPADDDSQIINWPCPLCDDSAPLSRRYRMALCTAGWRCRCPGSYVLAETAPLGFPSFERVSNSYFRTHMTLFFNYKGTGIAASDNDILLSYQSKDKSFDDMLDGRPDQLPLETHVDRRALAQEVVQRCLNDMRLERSQEEA